MLHALFPKALATQPWNTRVAATVEAVTQHTA